MRNAHELLKTSWSDQVIIDAQPEPLRLTCSETAVIVVDMQNDFCSTGGLFHRAGMNISPIQEVIRPTGNVLSPARGAGIKIAYLKMGFLPDLSDMGCSDSASRERHLRFGVGQPCC